jgi:predicted metal-dependent hydrolase
MTIASRPRWVPEQPFPPYSYVTGHFPHPFRDPRGHGFGHEPQPVGAVRPDQWASSRDYLAAIDLFNHGYYWEAHEAWEGVWHAAGRSGTLADFLKGLIKLAAAAVKAREGRAEGVRRHARRAAELFGAVRDHNAASEPCSGRLLGLDLNELIAAATRLIEAPPVIHRTDPAGSTGPDQFPPVEIVFEFLLVPAEPEHQ